MISVIMEQYKDVTVSPNVDNINHWIIWNVNHLMWSYDCEYMKHGPFKYHKEFRHWQTLAIRYQLYDVAHECNRYIRKCLIDPDFSKQHQN